MHRFVWSVLRALFLVSAWMWASSKGLALAQTGSHSFSDSPQRGWTSVDGKFRQEAKWIEIQGGVAWFQFKNSPNGPQPI